MRWLFLVFLLFTGFAAPAWSGGALYECRLNDGTVVPIVSDPTLNNVAVARIDKAGNRTIVYSPKYMSVFNVETRRFWLAHECSHHQLDQVGNSYTPQVEGDADCHGIESLLENNEMNADGLRDVLADIEKLSTSSPLYPDGPARARNIAACARKVLSSEK